MFGQNPAGGGTPSFSFGAKPATTAPAAAAPGMFGGFGAAATPATSAPGAGGLFGAAAPATTAPAASFGFGAAAKPAGLTLATGAPASTMGLFGAAPAPVATTAPGGMFGKPAVTTTAPGGGLFGAQAAAPAVGGLQFGQQQQQQQQQQQPQITAKTKYSDLPDAVRQQIDEIEKFIQQQIHVCDSISNSASEQPIRAISEEAQLIMQRLTGAKNMLIRDNHVMQDLKKQVNQELRNMDLASRYIDRAQANSHPSKFAAPQHDAYAAYFAGFANELERRMQLYRQHIEEIEVNVRSLMSSSSTHSPQAIQRIIHNQHNGFLVVASKVAHYHDLVERERIQFEKFSQKYLGDPKPSRHFAQASTAFGSTSGFSGPGMPANASSADEGMSLSAIASATLKPTFGIAGQQQQQQPLAQPQAGSLMSGGFQSGAGLGGLGAAASASKPAAGVFSFATPGASAAPAQAPATTAAPTLGGFSGFGASAAPAPTTTAAPTLGGFSGFGAPAASQAVRPGLFGSTAESVAPPAALTPASTTTGMFGSLAPVTTQPPDALSSNKRSNSLGDAPNTRLRTT
ncbi:hypothetical protein BC831DRAFT_459219 [Entophlyctis helioformis]|nr:hypothetical protein BC831DRAFT_459219 [Entophlyctis helioformis]